MILDVVEHTNGSESIASVAHWRIDLLTGIWGAIADRKKAASEAIKSIQQRQGKGSADSDIYKTGSWTEKTSKGITIVHSKTNLKDLLDNPLMAAQMGIKRGKMR